MLRPNSDHPGVPDGRRRRPRILPEGIDQPSPQRPRCSPISADPSTDRSHHRGRRIPTRSLGSVKSSTLTPSIEYVQFSTEPQISSSRPVSRLSRHLNFIAEDGKEIQAGDQRVSAAGSGSSPLSRTPRHAEPRRVRVQHIVNGWWSARFRKGALFRRPRYGREASWRSRALSSSTAAPSRSKRAWARSPLASEAKPIISNSSAASSWSRASRSWVAAARKWAASTSGTLPRLSAEANATVMFPTDPFASLPRLPDRQNPRGRTRPTRTRGRRPCQRSRARRSS